MCLTALKKACSLFCPVSPCIRSTKQSNSSSIDDSAKIEFDMGDLSTVVLASEIFDNLMRAYSDGDRNDVFCHGPFCHDDVVVVVVMVCGCLLWSCVVVVLRLP